MAGEVIAIVPAAGGGVRMGAGRPKQFLRLAGAPILSRTLAVLERVREVFGVIVTVPSGQEQAVRDAMVAPFGITKVKDVLAGGEKRQDSVKNGLAAALDLGADWVVVHDAVRPLARPELFARVLSAAREHGAAVAAVPCHDTVKEAGPQGRVMRTLDRGRLWMVQTPQAFSAPLLVEALARAAGEGYYATDEAGLIEWLGKEVRLVEGARENIKITTPADLRLAEGWLAAGGAWPRVGQGMDAHCLVAGRPLVLGGVAIPFEKGLFGHSDADVLTHAIMDALLGAAGLGDIGHLFPDTEAAYQDAVSLDLLQMVAQRLNAAGWRPLQVSATVVAQRPRLAPYIPRMRENLAARLGLSPEAVNVAATTTEGLGFTGREEGMAALATAMVGTWPGEEIL